jgi:hypothetical protein
MQADDRRLGLDRPIARRDFFNGVAIVAGAIAGWMVPSVVTEGLANEAAAPGQQSDYPPRLTGCGAAIRGRSNCHSLSAQRDR